MSNTQTTSSASNEENRAIYLKQAKAVLENLRFRQIVDHVKREGSRFAANSFSGEPERFRGTGRRFGFCALPPPEEYEERQQLPNYSALLREDPRRNDLRSLEKMEKFFGIIDPQASLNHTSTSILLCNSRSFGSLPNILYPELRRLQDKRWAKVLMRMGDEGEKSGNWSEALSKYQAAFMVDSSLVESLQAQGRIYYEEKKELVRALECYDSVLDIDRKNRECLAMRNRIFLKLRDQLGSQERQELEDRVLAREKKRRRLASSSSESSVDSVSSSEPNHPVLEKKKKKNRKRSKSKKHRSRSKSNR